MPSKKDIKIFIKRCIKKVFTLRKSKMFLEKQMEPHLRMPAHELLCFQKLVESGAANDEVRMNEIATNLSTCVVASIEFFDKVVKTHDRYFQTVHYKIFYDFTAEGVKLTVAKFLLYWYVIRPYTPVASSEPRFTFHSIQHAFYEFDLFMHNVRLPVLIQQWSAHFVNQQSQTLKADYDDSLLKMKNHYDDVLCKASAGHSELIGKMKEESLEREARATRGYDDSLQQLKKDYDDSLFKVKAESDALLLKMKTAYSESRKAEKKKDASNMKMADTKIETMKHEMQEKQEELQQLRRELEVMIQNQSQTPSKSIIQESNSNKSQLKILKSEVSKLKQDNAKLEEYILNIASSSPSSFSKNKTKESLDTSVREMRACIDVNATILKSEKILHVLQNYVVSSMTNNHSDFPAWLVVAQALLRSMCIDVGIVRSNLGSKFHGVNCENVVFLGLACWKIETRFRALSWLRNRIVRGFAVNNKMGNTNLMTFLQCIIDEEKTLAASMIENSKTHPDLLLEVSTLTVLKRETKSLMANANYIPVSGLAFVPTVPESLSITIFQATRQFALFNVSLFVSLMNCEGDVAKLSLLNVYFDLIKDASSLTCESFVIAKKKMQLAIKIINGNVDTFKSMIDLLQLCADSFQDVHSKSFLFFDAHKQNTSIQKRMLTLHEHAESLVSTFWSSQEFSRQSSSTQEELPTTVAGKIMAMEVLWNQEYEAISSNRKELDGIIMSLHSSTTDEVSPKNEANALIYTLSHFLIKGKMLMNPIVTGIVNSSATSNVNDRNEEIFGFMCNEFEGCAIREYLMAIHESINCFQEVRKGNPIAVNGSSSLGKILQSMASGEGTKKKK